MIQDLEKTFITPKNNDVGNFLESNTFNSNYVDLDTWISLVMAREI